MKQVFLLIFTWCVALGIHAQELPYSKYFQFDKKEFKENHFKYDDETNTWALRKVNGWHTTFNVLAIIADGIEDVRPGRNDYSIVVQMGKENKASYVKVVCYSDETYHKLLTFIKDYGQNTVETSSGKLIKHQAFLVMKQRVFNILLTKLKFSSYETYIESIGSSSCLLIG